MSYGQSPGLRMNMPLHSSGYATLPGGDTVCALCPFSSGVTGVFVFYLYRCLLDFCWSAPDLNIGLLRKLSNRSLNESSNPAHL